MIVTLPLLPSFTRTAFNYITHDTEFQTTLLHHLLIRLHLGLGRKIGELRVYTSRDDTQISKDISSILGLNGILGGMLWIPVLDGIAKLKHKVFILLLIFLPQQVV